MPVIGSLAAIEEILRVIYFLVNTTKNLCTFQSEIMSQLSIPNARVAANFSKDFFPWDAFASAS
jgi:hypothetical protein